MAKVLGEAGRFVSQAAGKKQLSLVLVAVMSAGVCSWASGFVFGFWIHKHLWWQSLLVDGGAVVVMLIMAKWAYRQLDILEKKRDELRRGARGEAAVAFILANFPDSYCVVNDLTTKFGNIDHVVVGPNGVFALDTKSWRGTISPDGNGKLLLNGRPSEEGKTHVKAFVRRVMEVRDKLKALAPEFDPYIQAMFVFTSAFVAADWGKTGSVHCMRDDQIYDYIVESKRPNKLKKEEITKLAGAFAALARMDVDFVEKASAPERSSVGNS